MIHQRRTDNQTTVALVALTPREIEILQCLGLGLSDQSIAGLLFLSSRTVQSHLYNIYRKIKVRNRTSAAMYAVRCGIVSVNCKQN